MNNVLNNEKINATNSKIKNSKAVSKQSYPKTVPPKPVQAFVHFT